jgi:hypothetical protein
VKIFVAEAVVEIHHVTCPRWGDAKLLQQDAVIAYDPSTGRSEPDLPAQGSGLRWEEFIDAMAKAYEARFE